MDIDIGIFGERFKDFLREAALSGLAESADELQAIAQDRLNTLYPPSSKPGESPHRRSGDGRRSVATWVGLDKQDEPSAKCGTSTERLGHDFNYMAYWETHGRPWLMPALAESGQQLADAFERGAREVTDG